MQYHITALCVFDAPKPADEADVPFKKFRELVQGNWGPDPAGWIAGNGLPVLAAVGPDTFKYNGNVPKDSPDEDFGFSEKSFHDFNQLSGHVYGVAANPAVAARVSGENLEAALQKRLTLNAQTVHSASGTIRVGFTSDLESLAVVGGPPPMKYTGEIGR